MDAVQQRVEFWKQRLVDLSRRNRLLYFRPSKRSSLRLVQPSMVELFERLAVAEQRCSVWKPPREQSRQGALGADPAQPQGVLIRRQAPGAGELVTAEKNSADLEQTLKNLYRRAHTDFEERGVRVLHVACGMLKWTETETAEAVRSPLVLVPVELERDWRTEGYHLSTCEDDPVLNPALQVKLQRDFRLALPPVPDAWEEGRLEQYLQVVRTLVEPRGWTVAEEAWLGLFSFHKLVIYDDLEKNRDPLARHPLIRALSGDQAARDALRGEPVDEGGLDEQLDPKDLFLIRDADGSQLACLRAVQAGRHLIVHGPPGTGKSQTITNIIADAIGHAKSVLFVSEKMAALDVVRQRLEEAGLGHFVLELHSQKANKREVVKELFRCYAQRVQANGGMSDLEYDRLRQRRDHLNAYVRALHEVRQPLGESARNVLARLAALADAPLVTFQYHEAERLTPQILNGAIDLAQRWAALWTVAREGRTFPWRGSKAQVWNATVRDAHEQAIRDAQTAVEELIAASGQLAAELQLPAPADLDAVRWLVELGELLASSPGIEPGWIQADCQGLLKRAQACQERQAATARRRQHLQQRYGLAIFQADQEVERRVRTCCRELDAVTGHRCVNDEAYLTLRHRLRDFSTSLADNLRDWQRDASRVAAALGLPDGPWTIRRMHRMAELVSLLRSPDLPDPRWLEPGGAQAGATALGRRRPEYERVRDLQARLEERYRSDQLAALELARLAAAFTGPYRWPTRYLQPGYYADRGAILACCRGSQLPRSIAADLQLALEWQVARSRLLSEEGADREAFGRFFGGLETDFGAVERSLQTAAAIRGAIWTGAVPAPIVAICSRERELDVEAAEAGRRLAESLTAFEQDLESLRGLLPRDRLPEGRLPLVDSDLRELAAWTERLRRSADALCVEVDPLLAGAGVQGPTTLGTLASDLAELRRIGEAEGAVAAEAADLSRIFGHRFRGMETLWEQVVHALHWAQRLKEHLGARAAPDAVVAVAARRAPPPDVRTVRQCAVRAEEAMKRVLAEFEPGWPQPTGRSLAEAPLKELAEGLRTLRERLEALRDWIDYGTVRRQLVDTGLGDLAAALEAAPPEASELPRVVAKALLQGWLDAVYAQTPILGQFRGQDHDRLIAEFRELDAKHWQLGVHRVIAGANSLRPTGTGVLPGSEVDVLYTEAHKSRRHMPLRRLFAAIPNLLPRLKPVVLMSPITVSQFLSASGLTFDLLVFDEASQICSEDAVGAIYRSRQVVICGDRKQLPPTSFFDEEPEDEPDDDEEDTAATRDYESVLDECMSFSLPSGTLRWHYRSKYESLIAFSNKYLYDGELVTFPSPSPRLDGLGLRFVHVPDGVYERGTTRTNPREAARVAELVFEHFRERPAKSLGVIAFSAAQAEAIEAAVMALRREHSEFEDRFAADRLRGFFVKNIENVQGDEREDIIISVGYGRDAAGRLTLHFGPLNSSGGERRLNVAVTRAIERLTLVSSIRSADIPDSERVGVRLLRRYLDYAERGRAALELEDTEGEPESPLEDSVAAAIRAMGFEVVDQVGCSGFRIDLGVRDPSAPGCFILGVECDGRTYHSSATARDRDRLRQQILTQLGWRLHRIWSSEWVLRREHETARLREAILQAQQANRAPTAPGSPQQARPAVVRLITEPAESAPAAATWQKPYRLAVMDAVRLTDREAALDCPSDLVPLVAAVIRAEGPVHIEVVTRRIAEVCGAQRITERVRWAVKQAVAQAARNGRLSARGEFLWPPDLRALDAVRVPDPGVPRSRRAPTHIPWEEYAIALDRLVREGVGMDRQALVIQTARVFGFDRTGARVASAIEDAISRCLERGVLREEGGRIVAGRSAAASQTVR